MTEAELGASVAFASLAVAIQRSHGNHQENEHPSVFPLKTLSFQAPNATALARMRHLLMESSDAALIAELQARVRELQ